MKTSPDKTSTEAAKALELFSNAGIQVDITSNALIDGTTGSVENSQFVAKIEGGAISLISARAALIALRNTANVTFQGDEIYGEGKTPDEALVQLADLFETAASLGAVATFKFSKDQGQKISLWGKEKTGNLKEIVSVTRPSPTLL
jgi:hypothetical protein